MNFTIRIANYHFSLINSVTFAGSLFFIFAFFSKLDSTDNIGTFLNADCLYLPSMYKDLFLDGNDLKNWNLIPAPHFFPDTILYFILMFVSKNSFIISSFIFAFIQYVVILYILFRLFRAILPNLSKHWYSLIYLLLSFFLIEYQFLTKEYYYSFYLLSNCFHAGGFIMALLCLLFTINYYKSPSYKGLLLILITCIGSIVSDRLFIVLYCVPVFISSFFLIKRIEFKHLLKFTLTVVIATWAGLKLFQLFSKGTYFHIDNPHKLLAFEDVKSSFDLFSEQMLIYMSEFGFKFITIYLFLLSFIAMVFLFFYTRKRPDTFMYFYTIFSIVFSVTVLSAPIINGNYTGYDTLRYNIYPLYLMALNIPLFLAYMIKHRKVVTIGKYAMAVVSVCFITIGVCSVSTQGLKNYFSYYPAKVQAIDQIAQEQGLLCGVGNFWEAKKITLFSKKGVRVYSVFEDLAVYAHAANEDWFFKNRFNFILLNGFNDTIAYKKNNLTFRSLPNQGELKLIKTNTFVYVKDKGYLPVNSSELK